uniref:Uncharacterized protein n=1 Tax=Helicotheca tamesis TaxID=374047 RepID=A0A7S2MKL4_9STRA
MDDETPSWLSEDTGDAAGGTATTPLETPVLDSLDEPRSKTTDLENDDNVGGKMLATSGAANESNKEPEDDPDEVSHMVMLMRIANLAVSIAIITCSAVNLSSIPSVASFVLSIYAILLGGLTCCFETQLSFLRAVIAINFGFFFNSIWRFFFYFLMGSILWAYDTLFGKIVAIATVAVGLFNVFVICRYPTYRKMREKMAKEEDKRIETKMKKKIAKEALKR